jgi:cell division protein FtsB
MKNLFVNMKKFLRKSSIFKNKRKLMYCINISLLVSIFALLFISLSGANTSASYGFVLKKLYFELGELKATNKNLTLNSAEMQSIARIKEAAIEEFGMVDSGERDYIVLNKNIDIVKK